MKVLAGFAVVAFTAAAAQAVGITFIHTGSGTGRIGDTPFENAQFTITSTGDTSNRQSFGGGFFIDHATSQISIANVGVFNITSGTRTFVNNGGELVGYSRAGSGGLDLYNGPTNAAFDTWDMTSDIGPIAGTANLLQWSASDVTTNAGVLFFSNASGIDATFQAIIPAPGSVALLGMGGLLAARRRR